MTQRQLHSAALLGGIALTVLMLWVQPRLASVSVSIMVQGGGLAFVAAAATKVIVQLAFFAPGLLVGWIAKTDSLSLGVLAGLVGALVYSIALGTVLQTPPHPYLPNPWSWVIGDALAQGLITGVAAGAAQLLRSNKSLERTRAR